MCYHFKSVDNQLLFMIINEIFRENLLTPATMLAAV